MPPIREIIKTLLDYISIVKLNLDHTPYNDQAVTLVNSRDVMSYFM